MTKFTASLRDPAFDKQAKEWFAGLEKESQDRVIREAVDEALEDHDPSGLAAILILRTLFPERTDTEQLSGQTLLESAYEAARESIRHALEKKIREEIAK